MIGLWYEDHAVGQAASLGSHTFTRDEIVAFAQKYDPQPFHLDEAAAVAARPSDRYDKRAIVTAGGAIVACALALFVATDSLPLAAVAAGAAGIGWGIFLVADWALACRVLPPGALATAMAIWNLAVVGPQIAAPLLAGALLLKSHILERQNWPRVAFTLAIAEIILGILWIWRLPRGLSVE